LAKLLHPDRRLMAKPTSSARHRHLYPARRPKGETWTPRFTYHGFRYVEVTGFPGKPDRDAITGVVVHSATPLVSSFEASDRMVNQLFRNIVWTQRANFFEVPTDCPQRDERLGWTGDAQAYARAATYNADVAAFFTKWLDDLEEAQQPNGAFTDYAPYPMRHGGSGEAYGTAWMDAGIICPYAIYKAYGDTRVIDRHWDAMMRFMQFRRSNSPEFQGASKGNAWGDWLSIGSATPIEYIDAVYFARTCRLMAEMARATIEDGAAVSTSGSRGSARVSRRTTDRWRPVKMTNQHSLALALDAGRLEGEARGGAVKRWSELIGAEPVPHVPTGFLGTKPCAVLSALSQNDWRCGCPEPRVSSWGI
jgi:alpha-L-rhamnosidase